MLSFAEDRSGVGEDNLKNKKEKKILETHCFVVFCFDERAEKRDDQNKSKKRRSFFFSSTTDAVICSFFFFFLSTDLDVGD